MGLTPAKILPLFLLLLSCQAKEKPDQAVEQPAKPAFCTECESFEEAMKAPEKVKELKINGIFDGGRLDSIPPGLEKLINLELLYLTDHNLKDIPREIGELKHLKHLSLAANKLTKLPEEIFQLKQLETFIVWDNDFSQDYIIHIEKRFWKELPNVKFSIR